MPIFTFRSNFTFLNGIENCNIKTEANDEIETCIQILILRDNFSILMN